VATFLADDAARGYHGGACHPSFDKYANAGRLIAESSIGPFAKLRNRPNGG